MRSRRGLTLIELMVVVAVVAVIAVIAAPSFRDLILMQRLRGVNAQVVTDLQFARSEAVSRRTLVRVSLRSNASESCYTLYTSPSNASQCECLLGAGSACAAGLVEIRTVQVPKSQSVTVGPPAEQAWDFAFDPTTGGIYTIPTDDVSEPLERFVVETYIDAARHLNIVLNRAGRPTVCRPAGSSMPEAVCAP